MTYTCAFMKNPQPKSIIVFIFFPSTSATFSVFSCCWSSILYQSINKSTKEGREREEEGRKERGRRRKGEKESSRSFTHKSTNSDSVLSLRSCAATRCLRTFAGNTFFNCSSRPLVASSSILQYLILSTFNHRSCWKSSYTPHNHTTNQPTNQSIDQTVKYGSCD